ncbi:transcriptional regulator [Levilactobacillus bambusae]|uniref:Transcriptional regulator n=1 Tax=Levilactobacillus bambusae TaxID=2024736 RepID=A0A2V1N041_9LACO|nr:transcriptional regulator [Levilactobacillus bambusae]
MRSSTKLSDAIHLLAYIRYFKGDDLSSEAIAKSIETSPVVVRRLMSQLSHAGLLITTRGKAQPELTIPEDQLTLLAIQQAVDPHPILTVDRKTNPKCPVGGHIQTILTDHYQEVEAAAKKQMAAITLADIMTDLHEANRKDELK